ncbi:hypothetical protein G6F57_021924 [Rhizopus arrhizus]|nr:hypothetical protein G6F57_021924 [Rhizopus arrhizus]
MALFGGASAIRTEARRVLDAFGPVGKGGHVFNLGHGISRFTPPEAVAELVDEVHQHSRLLRGQKSSFPPDCNSVRNLRLFQILTVPQPFPQSYPQAGAGASRRIGATIAPLRLP